jgi:hypothetical protein
MKYISMKMDPNGSTPVAAAITHGDVYLCVRKFEMISEIYRPG